MTRTWSNPGHLPVVHDILAALRDDAENCAFVRQFPGGSIVEPREVWIESLSVWVRADGFSYSGDLGRGYAYPDAFERIFIRRAVRLWEARR